ncbi:hypothetical protein ACQKCH_02820 [Nubsella zeaxanthinifaciens]|uniref:hypothetical protein n=1 Tax=Nubsella zeaxanthinifaciens TaxID=392412 RepID=UPI003D03EC16
MKIKTEQRLAIICTFVWIGFICAISFMEAWLKFRAPGVTLPIGLGIGRLVFAAMNKVEWVLALVIFISQFRIARRLNWVYIGILLILLLQTIWLLPALDARAQMYIDSKVVPNSYLHVYYVIAEGLKFIALFVFGIRLFKAVEQDETSTTSTPSKSALA